MADQGTQGRLSPWLRNQRIQAVEPYIKVGSILDYGCGGGALAAHVKADGYLGYDPDPEAIFAARREWPTHHFVTEPPEPAGQYDAVVSLAVLEHVHDPAGFLRGLAGHLNPTGKIMLTTPHPRFEIAHTLGAKLGIFSHDAHEEHEDLLDEQALRQVATDAGLTVLTYRRFLFGANQLLIVEAAR